MADDTDGGLSSEDDVASDEKGWGAHDTRNAETKATFNPKGIGSNVLLTAAAALVPLVIVGVAGLKTIFDARKPKR